MMKDIVGLLKCFLVFFLAVLCSCQQLPEDVIDSGGSKEEGVWLKISSQDKTLVPSVHLYVFTQEGKLIFSKKQEEVEEPVWVQLEKGTYRIIGFSGLSKGYRISNTPSLDDVVSMADEDGSEMPLMYGSVEVKVGDFVSTEELLLSNIVSSLKVSLKGIPTDVSAVQVVILPLHSSFSLRGEYGGKSQSVKLDCSYSSQGVWESRKVYVFPGNGNETYYSISFKMENGAQVAYSHVYKGIFDANRHYNLLGNYSGFVLVGGNFDVTDWDVSIDVEFDFGSNVFPDDEEDVEIGTGNIPEVGTVWNGTIVADVSVVDENEVELLLMTLDEWERTKDQVDEVIAGYDVNGISDWRLPTHTEVSMLRTRFGGEGRTELNELIAAYDPELCSLASGDSERYLCLKEGAYYSFKFVSGTTTTQAGKRSYYVRLVKTYRMTLSN